VKDDQVVAHYVCAGVVSSGVISIGQVVERRGSGAVTTVHPTNAVRFPDDSNAGHADAPHDGAPAAVLVVDDKLGDRSSV
jgi:hypothetical protein